MKQLENNKIFYSATKKIDVSSSGFNTPILSHEWNETTQNGEITFEDSITSIEEGAFNGCESLKNIVIPESVTSIEWSVFQGCTSLGSVTIPESVTSIGSYAFYGCTSLESMVVPEGVASIGECAFSGCPALKSISGKFATEDNRALVVGERLFAVAGSGLTEYAIPEGVKEIDSYVFKGCTSLDSVTIPDSVTSIESRVFAGCNNLKKFYGRFAADNGRCLIEDSEIIAYAAGSGTSYAIPDGVEKIIIGAFAVTLRLRVLLFQRV